MLVKHEIPIEAVRVPVKRAKTLEPAKVETLAEDILENGQQVPIRVRADPDRPGAFVLVEGLHRLEALRALGEETVETVLVQARIR